MRVISGITDIQLNTPTVVAIGKFDGVHLGHQMLIREITERAHRSGILKSVVFTFIPSPESLFSGRAVEALTTVSEKRRIFERMGVDILIEFPMTFQTAAIEPEDFVSEYLSDRIGARYVVCGSDISYGNKGRGDAALLRELGVKLGYECCIMDKVECSGEVISSTRIRQALEEGDIHTANAMLGAPYRITGTVSHGRHLGTGMGMPTVNVYIPPDKVTGPKGVYFSHVFTSDGVYDSITNIGTKPTVSSGDVMNCESYIYDFDGDLYGRYIEVELLEFSRPEQRFDSIDDLKTQMEEDIRYGREYHAEHRE